MRPTLPWMFEIRDAVIERRVVEVSNATGMMRLCHKSEVLMLDGTVNFPV
jgi:hypothetical protein